MNKTASDRIRLRWVLPIAAVTLVISACGGGGSESGVGDSGSSLTAVQVNEGITEAALECTDKQIEGTDTEGTITCQAGQQTYTVRVLPDPESLEQELRSACTEIQVEEFAEGGPADAQTVNTATGANWFAVSESVLVPAESLATALEGSVQTFAELCTRVGLPLWADVAPPEDPGEIESAEDLKAALEARLGLRCGAPVAIEELPPGFNREEITCSEGYVVIYSNINADSTAYRLSDQCNAGGFDSQRTDPFVLADDVYLAWEGGERGQRLIDALGGKQHSCKNFNYNAR